MNINPAIYETLREFKIDRDQGILALLGIYFKVDINKTCDPQTIRGINLTQIVHKDYEQGGIVAWKIPLFIGQQVEWDWLVGWNQEFYKRNPERAASIETVRTRMMEWFRKYPRWRQEDVIKATFLYLKTVKDTQYLKDSGKFIFEGQGGNKTSILLGWCEKLEKGGSANNLKGRVL